MRTIPLVTIALACALAAPSVVATDYYECVPEPEADLSACISQGDGTDYSDAPGADCAGPEEYDNAWSQVLVRAGPAHGVAHVAETCNPAGQECQEHFIGIVIGFDVGAVIVQYLEHDCPKRPEPPCDTSVRGHAAGLVEVDRIGFGCPLGPLPMHDLPGQVFP